MQRIISEHVKTYSQLENWVEICVLCIHDLSKLNQEHINTIHRSVATNENQRVITFPSKRKLDWILYWILLYMWKVWISVLLSWFHKVGRICGNNPLPLYKARTALGKNMRKRSRDMARWSLCKKIKFTNHKPSTPSAS